MRAAGVEAVASAKKGGWLCVSSPHELLMLLYMIPDIVVIWVKS